MKKFFQTLVIILTGISIIFATTLLLDLQFIQQLIVRQIIVYLILALQVFITYRIVILLNKK
jgi:hypothetical protein